MKKLNGITASKDGSYTRATVINTGSGWQLHRSEIWDINKSYKRHFLFHNGIHLGVECHWLQADSIDKEKYIATEGNNQFTACMQPFQHQLYADTFDFNLLGIHPDDMFLCTLPLYLLKNPVSSFVSVFQEELCWKIAVINERKLTVTFSFPITDTSKLHCCISRIEQYWLTLGTDSPFPDTVYLFNNQKLSLGEKYSVINIKTPSEDLGILKATGVAFCAIDQSQPAFSGPTTASKSRKRRTTLYFLSALLVSFSLLCAVTFYLINNSLQSSIRNCQQEYSRILTDNKEIRDLISQGENLAAKLERIEKLSTNVTCWSRFLHQLGFKRPPKLFFDRLGSEAVISTGTDKNVKLVLSGWADNETAVTELIKNLNSLKMIRQVSLSSMERDNKKKDYCRFKIICTLILSKS